MKWFLQIGTLLLFNLYSLNADGAVITLEPILKSIKADAQAKEKAAQAELKALQAEADAQEKAAQAQIEGQLRTQLETISAMLKGANAVVNGINGMTGGFFAGSDILQGVMEGYSGALSSVGASVQEIVEEQKASSQAAIQSMQVSLQKNASMISMKMKQQNALLKAVQSSLQPSMTLSAQLKVISEALGNETNNVKYIVYNTTSLKLFQAALSGFETFIVKAITLAPTINYSTIEGKVLFLASVVTPANALLNSLNIPFEVLNPYVPKDQSCPTSSGTDISICLVDQLIETFKKTIALSQSHISVAEYQNIGYLNGINGAMKTMKGSVDLNALIEASMTNAKSLLHYMENLQHQADIWKKQLKEVQNSNSRDTVKTKILVR